MACRDAVFGQWRNSPGAGRRGGVGFVSPSQTGGVDASYTLPASKVGTSEVPTSSPVFENGAGPGG